MILMRANPLLWPMEGVGPEILPFLGFASCHFRAHPFQWPYVMDIACIKIITSRATYGKQQVPTLIINIGTDTGTCGTAQCWSRSRAETTGGSGECVPWAPEQTRHKLSFIYKKIVIYALN